MSRNLTFEKIIIADAYLFQDNALFVIQDGVMSCIKTTIVADERTKEVILDEFFIKDRVLYFSFTDSYYVDNSLIEGKRCFSQEGSVITEINQLPAMPDIPVRVTGDGAHYKITTFVHKNSEYSRVDRKTGKLANRISSVSNAFNSFVFFKKGIIFAQKDESCRPSGVWLHETSMGAGPVKIAEYSHLWKVTK